MARTKMSEDEKIARRAVRDYLEALEATKPRRGPRRTPESIAKRLDAIEAEFQTATVLTGSAHRPAETPAVTHHAAFGVGGGASDGVCKRVI